MEAGCLGDKVVDEEEERREQGEGDKMSVHEAISYDIYVEGDAGGYM